MKDWKACEPFCDPEKLEPCPMLGLSECPECALVYSEEEIDWLMARKKAPTR